MFARFLAALRDLLTGRPRRPAVPAAVRRRQLELLLEKTGPVRILTPFPFATPLALLFFARWPTLATASWIAAFHVATIGCFLRRRALEAQRPITDDAVDRVLRGRVRDLLLLGGMWGLAPWMLDPHGEVAYLVLSTMFLVGALSLGSAMVSTHRQTVAAFAIPVSIGLVTGCAVFGGVVGWVLAACLVLFVFMTVQWTYQQADLLEDSLLVRFEKEDLAQRLARQVELVEQATRDRTRFFASASHDLRQPLHAMSLFASALERSPLPDRDAATVAQLSRSVRVLGEALDAMLDVSRLDAGAVEPSFAAVRVHELFLSLQTSFEGPAQARGLQLRLRSPGGLVVRSDPLLLERLLGNLVENAIKYTRSGGVVVAARPGAAAGRPGEVRFDVVDTGIGIVPEQQQQVFEEFYQVGNPQRDRRQGLGLGLSIVRRLAEVLRHQVDLSSRPGRGTRVHVWAPEALPAPRAGPEHAVPGVAGRPLPRRVLVVDDEQDSRLATATLLASYGCEVRTAADVAEAEAVLREAEVDFVVSDYRLPGLRDGLGFLLALRAASPQLRTLLVTGETAPERLQAIRASGIPCLAKPVRADRLAEALAG